MNAADVVLGGHDPQRTALRLRRREHQPRRAARPRGACAAAVARARPAGRRPRRRQAARRLRLGRRLPRHDLVRWRRGRGQSTHPRARVALHPGRGRLQRRSSPNRRRHALALARTRACCSTTGGARCAAHAESPRATDGRRGAGLLVPLIGHLGQAQGRGACAPLRAANRTGLARRPGHPRRRPSVRELQALLLRTRRPTACSPA